MRIDKLFNICHRNGNQDVCVVLFVKRVVFEKRKSIYIYYFPLLLSLCLICLSRYCCSVFQLSPHMSSLSLPDLVLLTLLRGNILAYNFVIIFVVL